MSVGVDSLGLWSREVPGEVRPQDESAIGGQEKCAVTKFDTVVLGLGATGSAAVYQLARRGNHVLGIDRFDPPHDHGSTHGETRITRLAIGEGPQYTPLALRSHELWREIERETGRSLLTTCGGLIISSAARTSIVHVENFFATTLAAAERFGIDHEVLSASELRRRFPQFNVRDDEVGYFEPGAGFVRPEECVRAQLALARRYGAQIRANETVRAFDASAQAVTVTTDRTTYVADRVIVAAGPWLPELLAPRWARWFKVSRQVVFWFDVGEAAASFVPQRFPVFIWELQGGRQAIYGFPAIDGPEGGIKVSTEQLETTTTAETIDRTVTGAEIRAVYENLVAPHVPAIRPKCLRATTCLYTVTPDFGFVIDAHPDFERVLVASPCSGHGFKHSAAIGEALAQRVIDGASKLDLGAFRMDRFG